VIKKLVFLLLLNLLIINPSFAYDLDDRPDWSVDDLQSNIKDYGFRIISTNVVIANEMFPVEIITLEKKGWILKCKVKYTSQIKTDCDFP